MGVFQKPTGKRTGEKPRAFAVKSVFTASLLCLAVLIQYPLWIGKGGWLKVWDLRLKLAEQLTDNGRLLARNASLEGEVRDLKQGLHAVEEQARYKLGMLRSDEIFIQINEPKPAVAPGRSGDKSAPLAQLADPPHAKTGSTE